MESRRNRDNRGGAGTIRPGSVLDDVAAWVGRLRTDVQESLPAAREARLEAFRASAESRQQFLGEVSGWVAAIKREAEELVSRFAETRTATASADGAERAEAVARIAEATRDLLEAAAGDRMRSADAIREALNAAATSRAETVREIKDFTADFLGRASSERASSAEDAAATRRELVARLRTERDQLRRTPDGASAMPGPARRRSAEVTEPAERGRAAPAAPAIDELRAQVQRARAAIPSVPRRDEDADEAPRRRAATRKTRR
jgi:hypothetical protein